VFSFSRRKEGKRSSKGIVPKDGTERAEMILVGEESSPDFSNTTVTPNKSNFSVVGETEERLKSQSTNNNTSNCLSEGRMKRTSEDFVGRKRLSFESETIEEAQETDFKVRCKRPSSENGTGNDEDEFANLKVKYPQAQEEEGKGEKKFTFCSSISNETTATKSTLCRTSNEFPSSSSLSSNLEKSKPQPEKPRNKFAFESLLSNNRQKNDETRPLLHLTLKEESHQTEGEPAKRLPVKQIITENKNILLNDPKVKEKILEMKLKHFYFWPECPYSVSQMLKIIQEKKMKSNLQVTSTPLVKMSEKTETQREELSK
jgi:hypothetical protein